MRYLGRVALPRSARMMEGDEELELRRRWLALGGLGRRIGNRWLMVWICTLSFRLLASGNWGFGASSSICPLSNPSTSCSCDKRSGNVLDLISHHLQSSTDISTHVLYPSRQTWKCSQDQASDDIDKDDMVQLPQLHVHNCQRCRRAMTTLCSFQILLIVH